MQAGTKCNTNHNNKQFKFTIELLRVDQQNPPFSLTILHQFRCISAPNADFTSHCILNKTLCFPLAVYQIKTKHQGDKKTDPDRKHSKHKESQHLK